VLRETPKRNLLWVDSLAGLTVGIAMLLLLGRLVRWYQLPRDLLVLVGAANVIYGLYSLSLAARARRPRALILLLIAANAAWAVACLRWLAIYGREASALGLAHLAGEALFVGGLAIQEWRWREQLIGHRGDDVIDRRGADA
jgi:hypothetical protein